MPAGFWIAIAAFSAGAEAPKSLDPRIVVERFAAEPDIVTPTGIAVDARGVVLVAESHTHFRPKGYDGPPADRIRTFEDTDGDGRADRIRTFYEGTTHTMGLAVYHDGSVFVATRNEVFRLFDDDGDRKADRRAPIARLDTPGNYPHNGLSGFAFDFLGDVYFGLGENLGAGYALIGQDGTTLRGGGEGGNVYRIKADGTGLTRVATGFWNPFHQAFDAFGRLFVVDNDPDSRPPCRLLHVVPGGDYGYRFRNGRKGLHPFTAWNGELPGTLPMVAGTGEAPSGVVVYESDNLPEDYRGDLLVTSWGDHRIERFHLRPRGASFAAEGRPVVAGGEDFRPVGIVVAPDGSLFVSDWVDKSYNVHGKGRIWHIRAVKPAGPSRPDDPRAAIGSPDRGTRERAARALERRGEDGRRALRGALRDPERERVQATALEGLARLDAVADFQAARGPDLALAVEAMMLRLRAATGHAVRLAGEREAPEVRAESLRAQRSPEAEPALVAALADPDPFIQQAAREGLKHSVDRAALLRLARDESAPHRLGALLMLRELGGPVPEEALARGLDDADPSVRFVAIQWVGEGRLTGFRPQLARGLASGATTRQLFEAYLAALERLDRGVLPDVNQEVGGQEYIARLLLDPAATIPVRRRALRMLRPDHPALTAERLERFLQSPDPATRIEAVRTLREGTNPRSAAILADLARRTDLPAALRAEAIAGLSGASEDERRELVAIATAGAPELRREALRSLRGAELSPEQREQLSRLAKGDDEETSAQVAPALGRDRAEPSPPAGDLDAWLTLLDGPADATAGERVFFHPKGPGCYRCHAIDGRGGRAGPELSATGGTLTRRRLVESILQPSKEIAPQFVPWLIARTDGTVVSGLLIDESASGEQTYADSKGATFTLKPGEVAERKPMATSIMPDDLARTMTLQDFRDLLAFLRAPRGGEPTPPPDAHP
jgi:putative membrane-bound dehydrogenase-like protein